MDKIEDEFDTWLQNRENCKGGYLPASFSKALLNFHNFSWKNDMTTFLKNNDFWDYIDLKT